ncbi:MAG TPA: hypothetical protein VLT79_09705 [Gemmatimonadales bacterium]|nr:hypothetical protein [Gemmatimonadales bacterium]
MGAPVKILMPLRVPELGSALGRLIVPRRLEPLWIPVDDIREELATRVMEQGGEGRQAAEHDDRARALEVLSRRSWLSAWERAVRKVAERAAQTLEDMMMRRAQSVRMPRRELRRRLLSQGEQRAIAARLGSGAERFVSALDALDEATHRVRDASVLDKDVHAEWQESLRTAARRLEAAWLALEDELTRERERWAPELSAIEHWRPSLWPVFVIATPVALALVWLGLVLGGYVAAPLWLAGWLGF